MKKMFFSQCRHRLITVLSACLEKQHSAFGSVRTLYCELLLFGNSFKEVPRIVNLFRADLERAILPRFRIKGALERNDFTGKPVKTKAFGAMAKSKTSSFHRILCCRQQYKVRRTHAC